MEQTLFHLTVSFADYYKETYRVLHYQWVRVSQREAELEPTQRILSDRAFGLEYSNPNLC